MAIIEADVQMVSKVLKILRIFQASISAYINLGILDPRNLTPADMNKLQWAVLCSSTDETISSEETYCDLSPCWVSSFAFTLILSTKVL